jgi:hypothetical protein
MYVAVCGRPGVFGRTLGTDPNPPVAGLYFNTNTHIARRDRGSASTLEARVNVAYLPGVTTLGLNGLLTF